jgi:hypothetical protein
MPVVNADGRIIENQYPAHAEMHIQKITGSPVDAAVSRNMAATSAQASASLSLGAGQRGSSRKRKRRKLRGGQAGHVVPPMIPTAGTIPGINPANNHERAGNLLAQVKADSAYDKYIEATPIKLGGRKKKTKTKRNGRNSKRNHRRKRSGRSTRRSRSHGNV